MIADLIANGDVLPPPEWLYLSCSLSRAVYYQSRATLVSDVASAYRPPNEIIIYDDGPGMVPHVAIVKYDDECFVVIEGATSETQLRYLFLTFPHFDNPEIPGRTNLGLWQITQVIRDRLLGDLPPGVPVLLTGHSYGSGIAQLLAPLLKGQGFSAMAVTFGGPRVGDITFAQAQTNTYNVHDLGDPVIDIPPENLFIVPLPFGVGGFTGFGDYRHGGITLHIGTSRVWTNPINVIVDSTAWVPYHDIGNYTCAMGRRVAGGTNDINMSRLVPINVRLDAQENRRCVPPRVGPPSRPPGEPRGVGRRCSG